MIAATDATHYPTPDCLMVGALALIAFIGAVVYAARDSSSLSAERAPNDADALAPGRLVNIDAGIHAGLCGWVRDMEIDADTGRGWVKVELNDGSFVLVERADVSPLFGG